MLAVVLAAKAQCCGGRGRVGWLRRALLCGGGFVGPSCVGVLGDPAGRYPRNPARRHFTNGGHASGGPIYRTRANTCPLNRQAAGV